MGIRQSILYSRSNTPQYWRKTNSLNPAPFNVVTKSMDAVESLLQGLTKRMRAIERLGAANSLRTTLGRGRVEEAIQLNFSANDNALRIRNIAVAILILETCSMRVS